LLKGKKILLGITGSIAAYKIPFLVRLLIKEGAEVQVVMTEAARDFVTPLTLSTLTNKPVYTFPFDEKDGSWNSHVDMGNWADVMLVAPASAATISKMAHGHADNLLLTTYLSAKCPVFFAPAMDLDMFKHPTTTQNVAKLVGFGHTLIEPQVGELASGLCGAGRMEEPENIVEVLKNYFAKSRDFSGKQFLVTAGPTYEAIDPVRFVGNFSSGQMGFAMAQKAAERGARVTLISGPTHLKAEHPLIERVDVVSAAQMYAACKKYFPGSDVTVMSAAVADFTPENPEKEKIKKSNKLTSISLIPTVDILAALGKEKSENQLLLGFALETENEIEHARIKLQNKNLDLIVLNSLKDQGAGFGVATNKVTILDKGGNQTNYPLKPKSEVAEDILDRIAELI
jgi:phosphopantothenoylcysteine decarboxylase/phosphopantothenate--cysteine ligase